MRRVGVLLPATPDDKEYQARVGAFLQALALLGWNIGRSIRIETRWAGADAAEIRRHTAELAALAPDVIVAHGSGTLRAVLQATRTVPIVFPVAADPVGSRRQKTGQLVCYLTRTTRVLPTRESIRGVFAVAPALRPGYDWRPKIGVTKIRVNWG
jgi:ABC-type uncharacterized transport system substrate-binding protein